MDLVEYVERHARSAEQTASLQGRWSLFGAADCTGLVPYRMHFGTALVPGNPLADEPRMGAVLDEFLRFCAARRWHAVFVPAGRAFTRVAVSRGCSAIKLGEAPLFDLACWNTSGRAGAKLRAAMNHAARYGVCADEAVVGRSRALREALTELHRAWLRSRAAAPLGFILGGDPAEPRPGRRWFVAALDSEMQAFVTTSPLPGHDAAAIDSFVRRPGAVRGSVESAVAAAIRSLRSEGVKCVTMPMAPLRGLEANGNNADQLILGRDDIEHRGALAELRRLRSHGSRVYRAESLERFKQKLAPTDWEPVYLVHYPAKLRPRIGVAAALELLPGSTRSIFSLAIEKVSRRLARGSADSR
ncbi:MAG: phosphatidylglycerol lysyltransferase domain-containing protein [Dehalococcoidia bacterium]